MLIKQLSNPNSVLVSSSLRPSRAASPDVYKRQPYKECKGALTDIGTEELAHLEIVATIVHQLTRNLTAEQLVEQGFGPYYIDHGTGIWPQAAGGIPFNACEFQSKGDVITDLHEDMAAEQKARSTYDNILRVVKDYDVCEPIKFLREREVVHYQRFGELLRITQDHLDSRNSVSYTHLDVYKRQEL